jgi:exopolysaccharide biosynthesis glucuronosyltransferase PssE
MGASRDAERPSVRGLRRVIFVTVGAQMPFPRLIDAVDQWARTHPDVEILAQIGDQDPPPTNLEHVPKLAPSELRARVEGAELVVAHAGMGTIITCVESATPLILLAREGARRETRNDHQVATAMHFGSKPGIWVAQTTDDIAGLLDRREEIGNSTPEAPSVSASLLDEIRRFIDA